MDFPWTQTYFILSRTKYNTTYLMVIRVQKHPKKIINTELTSMNFQYLELVNQESIMAAISRTTHTLKATPQTAMGCSYTFIKMKNCNFTEIITLSFGEITWTLKIRSINIKAHHWMPKYYNINSKNHNFCPVCKTSTKNKAWRQHCPIIMRY